MPLITLAQANRHLRLNLVGDGSPIEYTEETDDRVPDLQLKIDNAEAIVLNYLKIDETDLDGSPPSLSERDLKVIQQAAFVILSALYDDEDKRTVEDYMKPTGTVPLLLARLRDPTLA